MRKITLFLMTALTISNTILAQETHSNTKVQFTENKNQWEQQIKYKTQFKGLAVFLEQTGITYNFYNLEDVAQLTGHGTSVPRDPSDMFYNVVRYHGLKTHFLNANPYAEIINENKSEAYYNYFIGNDVSKWATDVHTYDKLTYKNIWNNIDLVYYSNGGNMKYDFVVKPGGDVKNIASKYQGADKLLLENGNLYVVTSQGTIIEQRPYAYQEINGVKKEVTCNFELVDNTLSFSFPKGYDKSNTLVVDPLLVASTFTGSTADNWGTCATNDLAGNIFTGGTTAGIGYPTTVGAYNVNYTGGAQAPNAGHPCDITITKFNTNGSALIYSTYIGGSGNERAHSLVCDINGVLYLYGTSTSANYPTTPGCYDNSFNSTVLNTADIVVTSLNAAGSALVGSTYIGGTDNDGLNINPVWSGYGSLKFNYSDDSRGEIDLDPAGNIYVASCTRSASWPTTAGAISTTLSGLQDGVVFSFNNTLTTLNYSTFLGGSTDDAAYSLQATASGDVYVAGGTNSINFPTTAGTLFPTYQGAIDGFIAHINSTGTAITAATYIGTASYDQTYFLQLDKFGDVYVYGQTKGTWPTTPGVYSNVGGKQFIQSVNPALTTTVFSTCFGTNTANPNLSPTAFLVDTCNNIYAAGWGRCSAWGGQGMTNLQGTTGMVTTNNALQKTTDDCDFYFIGLARQATSLGYATFFGSSSHDEHVDGGTSRFDKNGVLYQSMCAGCGGGQGNFPITPGAYSATNKSSNCNNAVIKLSFALGGVTAASGAPVVTGCMLDSVCFANNSQNATYFSWNFGDGSPIDTSKAPCHTYTTVGSYTVSLIAIDSLSCNISDTVTFTVNIIPMITVSAPQDTTVCIQTAVSQQLCATGSASITNYSWTGPGVSGGTTQCITATQTGTFIVTAGVGSCQVKDTVKITGVNAPVVNLLDTSLCNPSSINITINSGTTTNLYSWSTGATTSSITATAGGDYIVVVANPLAPTCFSVDTSTISVLMMPDLGSDTSVCIDDSLTLVAGVTSPGTIYSWNTGATSQSIVVNGTSTGTYYVVINNGTCIFSDSIIVTNKALTTNAALIPNVFTPNGDGMNEYFKLPGVYSEFSMKIYNRWGALIYETTNYLLPWDGKHKGKDAADGTYYYIITYRDECATESITDHGFVHVMR